MTHLEPRESRERNLWQEVLLRAVLDARLEPSEGVIKGQRARSVQDARAYLLKPSKDLEIVCTRAGMDSNHPIGTALQTVTECRLS